MADAKPPVPLIEDTLKQKQQALVDAQARSAAANQEVAGAQADIAKLQAIVDEINRTLAGYDKTSAAQQQKLNENTNWTGKRINIALAVVKDNKDKVDGIVKDFDAKLQAQQDQLKAASADTDAAKAAATKTDVALQAARATYDSLKKTATTTDAALKSVAALLDQAAKAEAASDFVAEYFLATEAQKQAAAIKVTSADDLNTAIRAAQTAMEAAKTDAATAQAAASQKATQYAALKQQVQNAQSARIPNLLDALKAIKL